MNDRTMEPGCVFQTAGIEFCVLEETWSVLGAEARCALEEEYLPRAGRAHEALLQGDCPGNDFLGWLRLPEQMLGSEIESIKSLAASWRERFEAVIVVGIGGSYLGARAVAEALSKSGTGANAGPAIYYLGQTLCSRTFIRTLEAVRGKRWGVIVISKSGTTLEPAVTFRLLRAAMAEEAAGYTPERVAVVTDARRGALFELAQAEGITRFVLPDDVGGRFSVLTPVGLLPLAIGGVDVEGLLQGAARAQEALLNGKEEYSIAARYAACRQLFQECGYHTEILAYYTPLLHSIGEWYKQLFGESEGKDGGGIYPSTLCYSTDLHSLGQYVQEGRRNLFETHLEIAQDPEGEQALAVRSDPENRDGLNYLEGLTLSDINRAIGRATRSAHLEGGVPTLGLRLERLDAEHLGALLYFFELSCGISGLVQGVNPFDQPGVEAYKRAMFKLLGKPGA